MPLGTWKDLGTVNTGDSAEIFASIDIEGIPADAEDVALVRFFIQKPDGTSISKVGEVLDDGRGFLRWQDTALTGTYLVRAQFVLESGEKRSTMLDFQVEDPFDPTPRTTDEIIADRVWLKIEDCFDSDEGGPWLRDMSLRYFDKRKIPEFYPEALTEINMAPPVTNFDIRMFTLTNNVVRADGDESIADETNVNQSVFVQAVLLAVIRHLMRSYVEQPDVAGAQVVYEPRRDYLQRWQTIYQMELERYERWLPLWKRQFLNLGRSALLVSSKAGRLLMPGMRTRYAARGWY